jgi:micrococcal nuclease
VLVAVIGIANRVISDDDEDEPTKPATTVQAQTRPTRTPESTNRTLATQPPASGNPDGFAPAFWTTTLPAGVELGNIVTIFDGDTFDITIDGQTNRYRLYRADTPETFDPVECGGNDATAFVRATLAQSDTPQQVWVEEVGQRDPYDRTLAYLWFTIDGQPYLLNHLLIDTGWAENVSYGDSFDPYRSALGSAADFAYTNQLGVWGACGEFGLPLTANLAPTSIPVAQPTQARAANLGANCHPSYIPCVPISPVDLDCRDVGFRVEVIGFDEYRLDNDDPDLIGCENWPPKP